VVDALHMCVTRQGPYGNDCSQSILSNPPANMSKSVSPASGAGGERVGCARALGGSPCDVAGRTRAEVCETGAKQPRGIVRCAQHCGS